MSAEIILKTWTNAFLMKCCRVLSFHKMKQVSGMFNQTEANYCFWDQHECTRYLQGFQQVFWSKYKFTYELGGGVGLPLVHKIMS